MDSICFLQVISGLWVNKTCYSALVIENPTLFTDNFATYNTSTEVLFDTDEFAFFFSYCMFIAIINTTSRAWMFSFSRADDTLARLIPYSSNLYPISFITFWILAGPNSLVTSTVLTIWKYFWSVSRHYCTPIHSTRLRMQYKKVWKAFP